ncbi:MAG: ribosome rescue protein RqcH [Halobacteriaceae archaeon]
MEAKRELTSVDLVALTGELQDYVGATVDKAYLYDDDLVRLKLRDHDRGRIELLVQVGAVKRVNVARPERVPDAPDRPPDFAKMMRNRLAGADLVDVSQHGFDRILVFEFRRGDADTTVVAELFGDGNLAVLDENREVVDSLETVRLRSRTVAPGARYEFPADRPAPGDLDREAFGRTMDDSDTDVVRTLATQLDLGGLWAEELCTRADVEKTLDIADADAAIYDALHGALGRLFERLAAGDLDPRLYRDDDAPVDVTPLPLSERADLDAEPFDRFNEALDRYFTDLGGDDDAGGPDRPDFEAEIEKRERIVAQQEDAIESFGEEADRVREDAELLYAEYDLVDEVLRTVREAREADYDWAEIEQRLEAGRERGIEAAEAVVDVDPADGTVTVDLDGRRIDLDPAEGVEHNADRLYTEAKEIEQKREGAEAALAETREELAALRARKENWTPPDDDETADDGQGESRDWLAEPSIPVRQTEHWYERFRWFHTTDGFLVIGGRDADDNEEIVEKYLEPHDRFLHAQAHGGPATVLKTADPSEPNRPTDVPAASMAQAATFAVSNSSVWKDGKYSGDVYAVDADQVSKTAESGEYLAKGGFAIRGDRDYYRDTAVGAAVGVQCEPETRVVGGPPAAVEAQAELTVAVEPGQYAQSDVAQRVYRQFREAFADTSFVRSVASPDEIAKFLPPGNSRIVED